LFEEFRSGERPQTRPILILFLNFHCPKIICT
jgi:hypothetical protein